MDFMEGGSLWEVLPRTNKAGQRPFQWLNRQCSHQKSCLDTRAKR